MLSPRDLKVRFRDLPHQECHGQGMGGNVFGDDDTGLNMWHVLAEPGSRLEPHSHPCDEIYCLIAGKGMLLIDDREIRFEEGEAFFIPGHVSHGFINDGESVCQILAFSYLEVPAPHKLANGR